MLKVQFRGPALTKKKRALFQEEFTYPVSLDLQQQICDTICKGWHCFVCIFACWWKPRTRLPYCFHCQTRHASLHVIGWEISYTCIVMYRNVRLAKSSRALHLQCDVMIETSAFKLWCSCRFVSIDAPYFFIKLQSPQRHFYPSHPIGSTRHMSFRISLIFGIYCVGLMLTGMSFSTLMTCPSVALSVRLPSTTVREDLESIRQDNIARLDSSYWSSGIDKWFQPLW